MAFRIPDFLIFWFWKLCWGLHWSSIFWMLPCQVKMRSWMFWVDSCVGHSERDCWVMKPLQGARGGVWSPGTFTVRKTNRVYKKNHQFFDFVNRLVLVCFFISLCSNWLLQLPIITSLMTPQCCVSWGWQLCWKTTRATELYTDKEKSSNIIVILKFNKVFIMNESDSLGKKKENTAVNIVCLLLNSGLQFSTWLPLLTTNVPCVSYVCVCACLCVSCTMQSFPLCDSWLSVEQTFRGTTVTLQEAEETNLKMNFFSLDFERQKNYQFLKTLVSRFLENTMKFTLKRFDLFSDFGQNSFP